MAVVVAERPTAQQVEPHLADLDGVRAALVGSPREGAQARQQLIERERLGHVVVGPEVEGADLLVQGVACRQHQHRLLPARLAQLLEGVEPVEAGQREVEDDQPDLRLQGHLQAVVTPVGERDLVALGSQGPLQEGGDLLVVLDDQDAHPRCGLAGR